MKLAYILVTWNSPSELIDDSIGRLHQFVSPQDIIVVDNGSTNCAVEHLKRKYPNIQVCGLPFNSGFAAANNVGIKMAMSSLYDAVCLLNVDTIIDEDFITPCVEVFKTHPDIGVVGPVVLEAHQNGVIQCEGGRIWPATTDFTYRNRGRKYERRDKITDVGYVLGAAMMIRREVIERIGCLDEDYFPAYVEEVDFCYRARNAGYRCVVHNGCAIRHIGEQSAASSQQAFNRISVHRFYFAIKHLGPCFFVLASVAIVARMLFWKCRSALFERWR